MDYRRQILFYTSFLISHVVKTMFLLRALSKAKFVCRRLKSDFQTSSIMSSGHEDMTSHHRFWLSDCWSILWDCALVDFWKVRNFSLFGSFIYALLNLKKCYASLNLKEYVCFAKLESVLHFAKIKRANSVRSLDTSQDQLRSSYYILY